jgi:hypothetical protein
VQYPQYRRRHARQWVGRVGPPSFSPTPQPTQFYRGREGLSEPRLKTTRRIAVPSAHQGPPTAGRTSLAAVAVVAVTGIVAGIAAVVVAVADVVVAVADVVVAVADVVVAVAVDVGVVVAVVGAVVP